MTRTAQDEETLGPSGSGNVECDGPAARNLQATTARDRDGPQAPGERSRRIKGRTKFQFAMSMLNLYVNRAGRGLAATERRRLEAAKKELRKVFRRGSAARAERRAA